jgi:tetratricopeptide (TPR) repeat protein
MRKIFFLLLIILNIQVLKGKGTELEILLSNNTWLKAELVKSDIEGNLVLVLDGKETILKHKDFMLVKMPKPWDITNAEKLMNNNKPDEAGELLDSIALKYNFAPIDSQIKLMQAELKYKAGEYKTVISLLKPFFNKKIILPQMQALNIARGLLLLGNAYSELEEFEKAAEAYKHSYEMAVSEYSALANLALGRILLKQELKKEASECFLENITIFPAETPGHKESLIELIAVYKSENNKKFKIFEDILKKEYPEKINNK